MASFFVFAICYILFVAFPRNRSLTAIGGALAVIFTGSLSFQQAFFECVQWNVIGLFFGTLLLADLFMQSRMPAVIAEKLVDSTRTMRAAILSVCALSSILSMFVENVAVVLVIAPVALSLAKKLKISPVKILILISLFSNLQGTATLVGDPPSMILAGHLKMTFNDFFVYQGRPSIFFVVQAGTIGATLIAAFFLRGYGKPINLAIEEKTRSYIPIILMLILIVGLSVSSIFDHDFKWFAGVFTLTLGGAGVLWYRFIARWGHIRDLILTIDWDTTFFLIGVFVIVGAVWKSGWLETLARMISMVAKNNPLWAYFFIVGIAVIISAFVDNVPFLLVMIPVTQSVAENLCIKVPFLMFGLLVGACLGGNITPIGASANIVTIGILRKHQYHVSFGEFISVGLPFTLAAVFFASALLWLIWGH